MRSFRDANKARDRDAEGRDVVEGKEPPTSFEEAVLSRLTRAVPEGFIQETVDRRAERTEEEREELGEQVDQSFEVDLGQEDVLDNIRELNDIQLEAIEEEIGLLQVIAESSRMSASILGVMLENQVDTLLELSYIREAVEPNFNLNVSGVAATEEPGEPVPVIPDSDDRSFNVRRLFVRAMPYNSYPLYFGDDGVSPQSGFILQPGEYIILNIDFRDTTIYMASEESGQEVGIMGVF